ncbi:MAG: 1-deoxy-D-xylulose-5-phosphate synthase [Bacteroidales bacterium]
MQLLEKINSPSDLKELDSNQLEQLCSELRNYIIKCCSENPGHIGASLGTVELTVALHKVFNTPTDKIIWDVGHQAYAHKILTGRRDSFKNNRKLGGISGFPKMAESKYDAFGTGHSSTSISAALGLAVAAEIQGRKEHVIAVIGDGAMGGGLAFEGLNNAGSLKTDILVILNDNQISIDQNIGALHNYLIKVTTSKSYNKLKKNIWDTLGASSIRRGIQKIVKNIKRTLLKTSETGSLFDSLGFRYFGPIDGNDINQLLPTLTRLKEIKGPKILHIITKKGKGYKPAEEEQTIWHAPGTFDAKTGKRTSKGNGNIARYQDVFGETLIELAKINTKIVGITPAMASGCGMNIFKNEIPERFFDVGIAEQHAVTFSAGLAAEGLLPYCNIYSSFMQRAYDNVIHDVALQNLKVVFCLDRGGLVGEDGATHHGLFDLAYFRPIPNICIAAPINELELRNMLYSASQPEYGITIIRYPRGYGEGVKWRGVNFKKIPIGKAELLQDGNDIALLSIGTIGAKGALAINKVQDKGISVLHYNMRFLKPIDINALEYTCTKVKTIITLEDGVKIGGLYSAVSEYIASKKIECKVIGLGIPDKFIEQGTTSELYSECKYNTDDIYNTILNEIQNK